jgi:IS1 family transposase
MVSWHIGDRSQDTGIAFVGDLKARLANKVQLTTDGRKVIGAVKTLIMGNSDPTLANTSFAERQNLTMRMAMRRFTRLTNAFARNSKTIATRWRCISFGTIGSAITRPWG